ncbi:beta-galactoside alpha-2,6-sialyltransferase 2 isoform X2 [Cimex lectularius]|uniref:Beta-galactoside alpha-2,6-sialyltransferase 1 n=1 Tax=Cimex lectularius TaxID=79782 RepID=A0A8I6RFC6_CIMLE|nr:beta-galactoside alpha-2,6-sialyltransferase 2 isoform X2 [Cimex lectularius]
MRAIAVSVWIFINLVFFGMCGYIYLLWSQYWHYMTKRQQTAENELHKIDHRPLVDYYHEKMPMEILHMQRQAVLKQVTTPAAKQRPKPRFKSHHNKLESNCVNCDSSTTKRIAAFKNRLIIRLRSVLHDESNVFKTKIDNPYNVEYHGLQKSSNIPPHQLLCRFNKTVPYVPTITGKESAFQSSPVRFAVPKTKLIEDYEHYNNCAIVSNSGALNGSNLDSHDLVLRFNHAPTIGYEKDVGRKTTIRILNSQVVSKKHFKFLKNKMYSGIKILVWDPCNYTSTLTQWKNKPDFDVFTPYVKHRRAKPKTNLHLLDPRILWTLWDFIQAHTSVRIRRNPPSSGFLGIALLLPHCSKIRLFEYIPSLRMTPRCHYFDNEVDSSCTFGVWHPLAAEKILSLAMNEEDDFTTYHTGFITISGYDSIKCGA